MAITQVSYGRLYNTGNYENVRFEAVVSVEGEDVPAAFEEAKAAVHAGFTQWQADLERERVEREAEMQRRRMERVSKSNPDF